MLADDLELVAVGEAQAGVEMRDDVVREAHRADEHDVDAVAADHLLRGHPERFAGQQPRGADAIATNVHQRASVQAGGKPDVSVARDREAERRADHPKPPDRARSDQLLKALRLWVVAVHERLHQQQPLALREVEHACHLVRIAAQRLLAEDVPAGSQCALGPLDVHRVGERDVDRLDLRIGEQRLVGAVRALDPALVGVRTRPLSVAARDRADGRRVGLRAADDELVVDPSRGQDSPLHRHGAGLQPGVRRRCLPARAPAWRLRRAPALSRPGVRR